MPRIARLRTLLTIVATLLLTLSVGIPAVASPIHQTTDVLTFAETEDVGDAVLRRNANSIRTRVQVEDAAPGAWTVWHVIWNTPEGCATPYECVEADLFNPDAGLAIGYAGGRVVGENGILNVAVHLREGEQLEGFPYPETIATGLQLTEDTMIDSQHAEVHLVMRHHGPLVRGLVPDMIRTFNGGCVYEFPIEDSAPTYGAPGPNTCADVTFAVFESVDAA